MHFKFRRFIVSLAVGLCAFAAAIIGNCVGKFRTTPVGIEELSPSRAQQAMEEGVAVR